MKYALRTPPLFATLLTLIGISILCALGAWQLQRLEWKKNLLATVETQNAQEFKLFAPEQITPENAHLNGEIEGKFLYDKEIALGPRLLKSPSGLDSQYGAHIITPLKLEDGQILLINRGWAPKDYALGTPSMSPELTVTVAEVMVLECFAPWSM